MPCTVALELWIDVTDNDVTVAVMIPSLQEKATNRVGGGGTRSAISWISVGLSCL